MAESISKRIGALKVGTMSELELNKLFGAIRTDLTNIRTVVNNLVNDIIKVNCNTASANNTVAITATAPAALNLTA